MSSVSAWSQVRMLELSIEFFNESCKWQLAFGRRPLHKTGYSRWSHFCGKCFLTPEKHNRSPTDQRFTWQSWFWDFYERIFFWPLTARLPPEGFSKAQIFQKKFIHSENTFFDTRGRKSTFWGKCSVDPRSVFFRPWGPSPLPWPLRLDRTINQHENRDFGVLCWKCFLDPADTQASEQFFYARLFSTRNREISKTNTRFEFLDPDYPSVNPYKTFDHTMFFWPCEHTSNQTFYVCELFSTRKTTILNGRTFRYTSNFGLEQVIWQ